MTNTSKTTPLSGKTKPLVFFGTEAFSVRFLTALIDADYEIAAVVTKPDTPKGRGHKLTPPLVKVIAEAARIPVLQPTKLSDIKEPITKLGDVAAILVSYGKIIPQSIIDLFSPGIINIHPSLLPKYRGPSPVESAILHGDNKTGVSIMQLSAAMDAGPVYVQTSLPLDGTEQKAELYGSLGDQAEHLLLETLPDILSGKLLPTPQDDSRATYCHLLSRDDSLLSPTILTAPEAERRVRAFAGFPKTKLTVGDTTLIITKAHVSEQQKTPLDVMFSDGKYLSIDELIAPSGKTVSIESYLRGYKA